MDQDNSADKELIEIINNYEKMKSENKSIYLDVDDFVDIAEYYSFNEKYLEAHEALLDGLKIHPDHPSLKIGQARVYFDEGNIEEARILIDIYGDSKNLESQMLNAEIYIDEGDIDKAEKILDSLELEGNDERMYAEVAYLYFAIGQIKKGINLLLKVMDMSPEDNEIKHTIAEGYQSMGMYDESIKLYESLLDKQPYSSEYWIGLAKAYFNQSKHDKAIDAADFALVAGNENGDANVIRAHSFLQLANYDVAVEEYKLALEKQAVTPEYAAKFISFCLFNQGKWQEALQYLAEAALENNEDSISFNEITLCTAQCFRQLGNMEDAHAYCKTILDNNPDYVEAVLLEAEIYLAEGKRKEADKYFDKLLKLSTDFNILLQAGEAALSSYCFKWANQIFNKIERVMPEFPKIKKILLITSAGNLIETQCEPETGEESLQLVAEYVQIPVEIIKDMIKEFQDEISNYQNSNNTNNT